MQARIGALGAGKEWFKPWRTITGREDAAAKLAELQVVLEGVFEQRRFLDLVRHFIVFEDEGGGKLIEEDGGLPPVPRGERGGGGDAARRAQVARRLAAKRRAATRPGQSRAATRATGAWAWSGTRRARARA